MESVGITDLKPFKYKESGNILITRKLNAIKCNSDGFIDLEATIDYVKSIDNLLNKLK